MPFARQTVQQLIAQLKAGFEVMLRGADTALRRSNLVVSAILMGGAVDAQYGYLDWIIDNCLLPDRAISPYSDRWGAIKGASRKPPVAASGTVDFTGLVGTVLPAGALWQLGSGVVFATTADAMVGGGGTGAAAIEAQLTTVDADGTLWNCGAGASLSLVAAVAGIDGTGTVDADIANGAGPESNTAFRARYLKLFRQPPHGGDANDYVEWALQVPAVTRAWCVPLWAGAGTVAVYFMDDVTEAAHGGFPQGTNGGATAERRIPPATGDQLVLTNYLYPLRPVTALVYALAPAAAAQNFTLKYVPSAQQAAVEAAIAGVLAAEGAPDGMTAVELSDIQAAVHAVPLCEGALVLAPADNITTALGFLPTLGTVNFP